MSQTIVVSWVAWFYDFQSGEVNPQGPTFDMHRRFFNQARPHQKHLLLSTGPVGDTRSELLLNHLQDQFPEHEIELKCLDVLDPFDYQELKLRVERVLNPYAGFELDVLYSNGTTPMRMVWLVLHLEDNGFRTRLIQGQSREVTGNEPAFPEVQVDTSLFTQRIHLRSQVQNQSKDLQGPFRPAFLEPLYDRAERIAQVDGVTTLIEGESGVGKELLARHIHLSSARKRRPQISVNCAAIRNESMLESRLFGHKQGSFTDATQDQEGLIVAAQGGTLFLDEIGDISASMQVALLRVLQEKRIRPVGATQEIEVDVRIIAATNRDLWEACRQGTFRWDLYYRLTETRLRLPSLREYPLEERQAFHQYFLRQKAREYQRPQLQLSAEVERLLLAHDFPGNLRELENLMTHFYVFAEELIQHADIPEDLLQRYPLEDLTMETARRKHARKVYRLCGENLSQTARVLDIAPNTLRGYLREE